MKKLLSVLFVFCLAIVVGCGVNATTSKGVRNENPDTSVSTGTTQVTPVQPTPEKSDPTDDQTEETPASVTTSAETAATATTPTETKATEPATNGIGMSVFLHPDSPAGIQTPGLNREVLRFILEVDSKVEVQAFVFQVTGKLQDVVSLKISRLFLVVNGNLIEGGNYDQDGYILTPGKEIFIGAGARFLTIAGKNDIRVYGDTLDNKILRLDLIRVYIGAHPTGNVGLPPTDLPELPLKGNTLVYETIGSTSITPAAVIPTEDTKAADNHYKNVLRVGINARTPVGTQTAGANKTVLHFNVTNTGYGYWREDGFCEHGEQTRDVEITAFTFTVSGTVNLQNMTVRDENGNILGTSKNSKEKNSQIHIVLDRPSIAPAGSTLIIKVTADTIGATNPDWLQVNLTDVKSKTPHVEFTGLPCSGFGPLTY